MACLNGAERDCRLHPIDSSRRGTALAVASKALTGRICPSLEIMDELSLRWEWRVFGKSFAAAEDWFENLVPVAVEESDELYLLSSRSNQNAQVRAGRMELKILEQLSAEGLEQWRTDMQQGFPLTVAQVQQGVCGSRGDGACAPAVRLRDGTSGSRARAAEPGVAGRAGPQAAAALSARRLPLRADRCQRTQQAPPHGRRRGRRAGARDGDDQGAGPIPIPQHELPARPEAIGRPVGLTGRRASVAAVGLRAWPGGK
jgi:hypothetical protein